MANVMVEANLCTNTRAWYKLPSEPTTTATTQCYMQPWASTTYSSCYTTKSSLWYLVDRYACDTGYVLEPGYEIRLKTPLERLQEMLRMRRAPAIIVPSRKPVMATTDIREIRARSSLRSVLGNDSFRLFLKNGFVSIQGKSGRVYQIYPGHNFTKVYDKGQLIEELCVILSGSYCPTDSILMRYVMLLNDEDHFRHLANKHRARPLEGLRITPVDNRSLTDIYASLKNGGMGVSTVKTNELHTVAA